MNFFNKNLFIFIFTLTLFNINVLRSDEKVDAIIDQMQIISQDLKTLEKAFYKKSDILINSKSNSNNNFNDISLFII